MQARTKAMQRWVRLSEAAGDENPAPDQDASNFHIPLVQWQKSNKMAKELGALFGEEAEVIATPVGKEDVKNKDKVKRWMTYRLRTLGLYKKYYDYLDLKNDFGTTIAHIPYKTKKRLVKKAIRNESENFQAGPEVNGLATQIPVPQTEVTFEDQEIIEFEGLDFIPENIEDWAVPKGTPDLKELDHFTRRLRLSVDEILDLMDEGKIDSQILTEKVEEKLRKLAEEGSIDSGPGPDPGKRVREEKKAQAGQKGDTAGDGKLTVLNWFGKFRTGRDGDKKREQHFLVAFFQQDLHLILGAARLVDIFPDGRLPFLKSDGIRRSKSFWGIGLAELLESISNEMDMWHNIVTDAGLMAVAPPIGYKPSSGWNPQTTTYGPRTAYPLNDPKNDMARFPIGEVNLQPYVVLMPQMLAMAERLTGLTEGELGRQFSGPNAPRTAAQQFLLAGNSGQRLGLDLNLERETFKELLQRIWDADKRFLPKPIFFRVTEEDAGSVMDVQDFDGDFDFDLGPPTSISNRSQRMQELLQAYALTLQNPIAQQNPALLAAFLKKVLEKFNLADVAKMIPDLSDLTPPQSAEEENARMLQGEDVDPHPQDNHQRHIAKHTELKIRIGEDLQRIPGYARLLPPNFIGLVDSHIAEHQQAMKTSGASLNTQGLATQGQGGGGAASPQVSDISGSQQFNPGGNEVQANLASLLNQGGTNLG